MLMYFKKKKLKKERQKYKEEIKELEAKLARSQSSCVKAFLQSSSPSKEDIEYHNLYMENIEKLRKRIQKLDQQLDE